MWVVEDGFAEMEFLGLTVHFFEKPVDEGSGGVVASQIDRFDFGVVLAFRLH